MNSILSAFARTWLKDNLALCKEGEIRVFKRMYAPRDNADIGQVVDEMPDTKLDWAMSQVLRTLDKRGNDDA